MNLHRYRDVRMLKELKEEGILYNARSHIRWLRGLRPTTRTSLSLREIIIIIIPDGSTERLWRTYVKLWGYNRNEHCEVFFRGPVERAWLRPCVIASKCPLNVNLNEDISPTPVMIFQRLSTVPNGCSRPQKSIAPIMPVFTWIQLDVIFTGLAAASCSILSIPQQSPKVWTFTNKVHFRDGSRDTTLAIS